MRCQLWKKKKVRLVEFGVKGLEWVASEDGRVGIREVASDDAVSAVSPAIVIDCMQWVAAGCPNSSQLAIRNQEDAGLIVLQLLDGGILIAGSYLMAWCLDGLLMSLSYCRMQPPRKRWNDVGGTAKGNWQPWTIIFRSTPSLRFKQWIQFWPEHFEFYNQFIEVSELKLVLKNWLLYGADRNVSWFFCDWKFCFEN